MNIEETDYVEIVERCNLKTGVNTVFSGGVVLRSETLDSDEIFDKYKEYLTKYQVRNLYRDAGSIIELDLSALKECNNFSDMLKVFTGNYPNYIYGIDPYKFDSTLCDIQVFKNESRH